MKKFIVALLTLVLIVSVLAIPANADDGGVKIVVTANKDTVYPNELIIYTFTVESNTTITSLQCDFVLPQGITFTPELSSVSTSFSDAGFNLAPALGNPTVTLSRGSVTGNFTIGTLTGTVTKQTPLQTYPLTLSNAKYMTPESGGSSTITAGTDATKATVTVSHGDPAKAGEPEYDGYHDWPSVGEVTDATCTTPKSTKYTCSNSTCNATKVVTEGQPKGHDLSAEFNWGNTNGTTLGTVTATVTCANNCEEYGQGKAVTVKPEEITRKEEGTSCTAQGKVTYEANITVEGTPLKGTSGPFEVESLGHLWPAPKDFDGFAWNATADNATATVAIRCAREGCLYNTQDYTPTVNVTKGMTKEAKCETDGSQVYNASVTIENPTTTYNSTTTVTLPKLGHKWSASAPTVIWEGNANEGPRSIKDAAFVEATCENGDKCDGDRYLTFGEYSSTGTPATCTEGGNITYSVDGTTKDGKKTYTFTDEEQTLNALGHAWSNDENDVVINWQGNAPNFVGTTATRPCTREGVDHTQSGNVTMETVTQNPTYTEPGLTTYKATVKFDADNSVNTENQALTYVDDTTKTEPIPMLEPIISDPDVTFATQAAADTADVLQDAVDKLVDAALAGTNNGLPDEVFNAIHDNARSNTNGMNVTTKLVVADKPQNATGIPGVDDANVKDTYDIHIEVTVKDGPVGAAEKKGNITEIASPITFELNKPSGGGPIYYVMNNHSGTWTKVTNSKVVGNKIVFSASQFSDFAIISSNDLKDATIEPNPIPDQTYTGSEIKPAIKVYINGDPDQLLKEGEDYIIEYADNTNVGTASITIKPGSNNTYTGSQTVHFNILAKAAAASSNTSKTAPATGDETPVALYAGILTLSVSALAVVCIRRKKTH